MMKKILIMLTSQGTQGVERRKHCADLLMLGFVQR